LSVVFAAFYSGGARWDSIRKQRYVEGGWDLTPFLERWDVYVDCAYLETKWKGAVYD
jgi:hypothetical protein